MERSLAAKNCTRRGTKTGTKGHKEPIRYQRFDYSDPPLKCMAIIGGFGTSRWTQYEGGLNLAAAYAYLCVKDAKYFTNSKTKQLARSLGIKTGTASLKLKAEPPEDLTLDFSSFKKVTGKRNNYSLEVLNVLLLPTVNV